MDKPQLRRKDAREFLAMVGAKYPHYDFSEFIYTGCNDKSIVICPTHGHFIMRARSLLQKTKHPCPQCQIQNSRLSYASFLQKANTKHDGKYTYDKTDIENANWHDKIKIKCPNHGYFYQTKGSHLGGCGCPDCYKERLPSMSKLGTEAFYRKTQKEREKEFITKAVTKFDAAFDYSKVHYINQHTLVIITCSLHGDFETAPYKHLQSPVGGCPACLDEKSGFDYCQNYAASRIGQEIGVFYKILFTHKETGIKFIKVGITTNTIKQRFKQASPDFDYIIIDQIQDTNLNCAIMEQQYKSANWHRRFYIPKEWKFSGKTECYEYDRPQQLKYAAIKHIRDSLLQKQNNVCGICHKPPKNPVLDHDHTKKTKGTSYCRGVLCSNCNIFLAKVENNMTRYGVPKEELPNHLKKMADFLQWEQTNLIHPSEKPPPQKLMKSSYNKLKRQYTGRAKFPPYPRSGRLTKELEKIFKQQGIQPEFYKIPK